MGKDAPKLRELFIEELAEVHGGRPLPDVQTDPCRIISGLCATTMACCEEGSDNCCA